MFGIDQGIALELDGGVPSGPSGLRAGVDVGSDAGSEGKFHMSSKKHDEVRPVASAALLFSLLAEAFLTLTALFPNIRECSAA